MILAFDSSLPVLSVALVGDSAPLGAIALEGKESRNEKLLPAIEAVLDGAGVDRTEVRLIAVTRGPGSFTGVRIGLATAEGLALALGVPICAIPTHEVVASAYAPESVLVANDALRGEFYVSGYRGAVEVLSHTVATSSELDDARAAFDRLIDVRDILWTHNLALLAAKRASEIRDGGGLASYADTTPVYVRLAEAEARLLAKNA